MIYTKFLERNSFIIFLTSFMIISISLISILSTIHHRTNCRTIHGVTPLGFLFMKSEDMQVCD